MYSALAWVRKGALNHTPKRANIDEDDVNKAKLRSAALAHAAQSNEQGEPVEQDMVSDQDNSDGWEDVDEDGEDAAIGDDGDDDDDDDDADAPADKAKADALIDAFYPSDEEQGRFEPPGGIAGILGFEGGDPYLQLRNGGDGDDDSDIDDFEIMPDDAPLVLGRSEDEFSSLEMHIYEEGEDNLYVHHDTLIPAFPLSLSVLDITPGTADGGGGGNYCAVGSFRPEIEIWDLDTLDSLEPHAVLGGLDPESIVAKSKGEGKKKKKGKKGKDDAPEFLPGSHKDAVLSLSHNRLQPNLLASGSADGTVKVWDLATLDCLQTFEHHAPSKVQVVAWNPAEATVLLTASYDKTAAIIDVRATSHLSFPLNADAEQACWDPHAPRRFYASNESGQVLLFDLTSKTDPAKPVYTIHAHDDAVSALTVSPHVPNLIATGSPDKTIKLWHCPGDRPTCIFSRNFSLGPVFCLSFSPDTPLRLAAAGGSARVVVWDASDNGEIRRLFTDFLSEQQRSQAMRERGNDGVTAYDPDDPDADDDGELIADSVGAMAIDSDGDDSDGGSEHGEESQDAKPAGEAKGKKKDKKSKKSKKGKK